MGGGSFDPSSEGGSHRGRLANVRHWPKADTYAARSDDLRDRLRGVSVVGRRARATARYRPSLLARFVAAVRARRGLAGDVRIL